jgi:HKD family nuclease
MSDTADLQKAIDEISAAFEKNGIIDYFFVGFDVSGKGIRNYCYGSERKEVSNSVRYHTLVGAVESYKARVVAVGEGFLNNSEE